MNDAKCDLVTGHCRCMPGWAGAVCNMTCDEGFYGDGCLEVCSCLNGADCDHISGRFYVFVFDVRCIW